MTWRALRLAGVIPLLLAVALAWPSASLAQDSDETKVADVNPLELFFLPFSIFSGPIAAKDREETPAPPVMKQPIGNGLFASSKRLDSTAVCTILIRSFAADEAVRCTFARFSQERRISLSVLRRPNGDIFVAKLAFAGDVAGGDANLFEFHRLIIEIKDAASSSPAITVLDDLARTNRISLRRVISETESGNTDMEDELRTQFADTIWSGFSELIGRFIDSCQSISDPPDTSLGLQYCLRTSQL
jgi:hypothetical protein